MSGLSQYLGKLLSVFSPAPVNTVVIAGLVSLLTEITSNAAVINVVTPIIIYMVCLVTHTHTHTHHSHHFYAGCPSLHNPPN